MKTILARFVVLATYLLFISVQAALAIQPPCLLNGSQALLSEPVNAAEREMLFRSVVPRLQASGMPRQVIETIQMAAYDEIRAQKSFGISKIFKNLTNSGIVLNEAEKRTFDPIFFRYSLTGKVADLNGLPGAGVALKSTDPTNWFTHDLGHLVNVIDVHAASRREYLELLRVIRTNTPELANVTEREIQLSHRLAMMGLILHDSDMYLANAFNVSARATHAETGSQNVSLLTANFVRALGASPEITNQEHAVVLVRLISEYHSKSASGELGALTTLEKRIVADFEKHNISLTQAEKKRYRSLVALSAYLEGASDVMRDRGTKTFARPSGNRTYVLSDDLGEVEIYNSSGLVGRIDDPMPYVERSVDVRRTIQFSNNTAQIRFQLTDLTPDKRITKAGLGFNGFVKLVKDLVGDHSRGLGTTHGGVNIRVFLDGREIAL